MLFVEFVDLRLPHLPVNFVFLTSFFAFNKLLNCTSSALYTYRSSGTLSKESAALYSQVSTVAQNGQNQTLTSIYIERKSSDSSKCFTGAVTIHIHSLLLEHFGVQYLAQEYFDTLTDGRSTL